MSGFTDAEIDKLIVISGEHKNNPATRETIGELAKEIKYLRSMKRESGDRAYPRLLSEDEKKALLKKSEDLLNDLMGNKLGGYEGINRPFWIMSAFKEVIEEYGNRDVGLTWSYNDLKAAKPTNQIEGGN